jgi:uncharacterized membrane protein YhaH (DUF805 family)
VNQLLASLRHNLGRLVRFSGHDSRRLFWPWAIFVVAGATLVLTAVLVPLMATTMGRMQQFAAEHPDQADVVSTPTSYQVTIHGSHPELFPPMDDFILGCAIGCAVIVLLLAASVVRRLHDAGRTGWWGLPPTLCLAAGIFIFRRISASFSHEHFDHRLFLAGALTNLVYLGSLVLLIALLAQPGHAEANRHGTAPPKPGIDDAAA